MTSVISNVASSAIIWQNFLFVGWLTRPDTIQLSNLCQLSKKAAIVAPLLLRLAHPRYGTLTNTFACMMHLVCATSMYHMVNACYMTCKKCRWNLGILLTESSNMRWLFLLLPLVIFFPLYLNSNWTLAIGMSLLLQLQHFIFMPTWREHVRHSPCETYMSWVCA